MPNYTVEEPDENEHPALSQLPHGARPRRSSPGIHVGPSPGLVNPSSFVVAETEDVSRAWTVSTVSTSRSPRQESPTPAVPPSSPQPGLIHGDHTDMVGPQGESPSTTPSRRPSSPRSPCQEEFHPRDNTHQAPYREAGDLGTIYHHIHRQNEKLKRKRDYLHRLRFRLCRKEEELGIWESQLEERETRRLGWRAVALFPKRLLYRRSPALPRFGLVGQANMGRGELQEQGKERFVGRLHRREESILIIYSVIEHLTCIESTTHVAVSIIKPVAAPALKHKPCGTPPAGDQQSLATNSKASASVPSAGEVAE
ncbi:MAG: hypothetical protein Q9192_002288 [Flavoplaca navasiana]